GLLQEPDDLRFRKPLLHVRLPLRKRTLLASQWTGLLGAGHNLRMSAAALWAGFEALFGINAELRFRLAALAAAYLEERGPNRLALYRRVKTLYDYRSKAVHGAATSDKQLASHILEVRGLLSRLMCRATQAGVLPSTDDFEELLFT
ncbi:HEPN domain-containing protein, partial [Ralstonia pseudosolanacearum]|uniref:HEPN domain-containing protein n=1 Tax=Ralstonia pseudosolanacearum TaxID=1310165 RepID=UPI001CB96AC5